MSVKGLKQNFIRIRSRVGERKKEWAEITNKITKVSTQNRPKARTRNKANITD